MARPRKPEAEHRSRTIGVRVTTADAVEIAERAGAARMTKGGYMRRRALGLPVREATVHRLGARERVEDTRNLHVHVIANRIDPETGNAATLGNSKLRLSRWAEGYEREHGRIRCEERVKNNARRRAGEEVVRNRWERPLTGRASDAKVDSPVGRGGRKHRTTGSGSTWNIGVVPRLGSGSRSRTGASWGSGGWRLGRGRNGPHCTSGRRTCGRGSTGRAAPCAADSRPGGPSARYGNWLGRSGAGRTWSRAAREPRPVPQGREARAGQGSRRQRPADRAAGARGLPKWAAGRRAARTADRHRAGGSGDQGARPEHNPCSYLDAPAPITQAWRGRV